LPALLFSLSPPLFTYSSLSLSVKSKRKQLCFYKKQSEPRSELRFFNSLAQLLITIAKLDEVDEREPKTR